MEADWLGCVAPVADLVMALRDACPEIHALMYVSHVSPCARAGTLWPMAYGRSGDRSLSRLGYKRLCPASWALSPGSHAVGRTSSQVWVALWRGSHGRRLKPPAKSWQGTEACQQHEWAGEWTPQFQLSLEMPTPVADNLMLHHERPWDRITLLSHNCMPDPQKPCEVKNGCCLILLKFGG